MFARAPMALATCCSTAACIANTSAACCASTAPRALRPRPPLRPPTPSTRGVAWRGAPLVLKDSVCERLGGREQLRRAARALRQLRGVLAHGARLPEERLSVPHRCSGRAREPRLDSAPAAPHSQQREGAQHVLPAQRAREHALLHRRAVQRHDLVARLERAAQRRGAGGIQRRDLPPARVHPCRAPPSAPRGPARPRAPLCARAPVDA